MNELFLVDSGAQYEDGTTDVTRTVAVGTPSAEMRDRFTRVLKGHIAIATAVFPESTSGAQLDSLARTALWQAGLDFDHGTGHGVGSYLSVHEGPARISKLGTVALKRGMILSNEPGYYKTGAYGIRIENLVLVIAAPEPAGAEKPLNAFETLTLAPIDRAADRCEDAHGARSAPGSTPIMRACARRSRRWSTRRRAPGSKRRRGRFQLVDVERPLPSTPQTKQATPWRLLALPDGDDSRSGRCRSTSWCRRSRGWRRGSFRHRHDPAHHFALSARASAAAPACRLRSAVRPVPAAPRAATCASLARSRPSYDAARSSSRASCRRSAHRPAS